MVDLKHSKERIVAIINFEIGYIVKNERKCSSDKTFKYRLTLCIEETERKLLAYAGTS
jgi:hypothetical protein